MNTHDIAEKIYGLAFKSQGNYLGTGQARLRRIDSIKKELDDMLEEQRKEWLRNMKGGNKDVSETTKS